MRFQSRLTNNFFLKDGCALPDQMSLVLTVPWRAFVFAMQHRDCTNMDEISILTLSVTTKDFPHDILPPGLTGSMFSATKRLGESLKFKRHAFNTTNSIRQLAHRRKGSQRYPHRPRRRAYRAAHSLIPPLRLMKSTSGAFLAAQPRSLRVVNLDYVRRQHSRNHCPGSRFFCLAYFPSV